MGRSFINGPTIDPPDASVAFSSHVTGVAPVTTGPASNASAASQFEIVFIALSLHRIRLMLRTPLVCHFRFGQAFFRL